MALRLNVMSALALNASYVFELIYSLFVFKFVLSHEVRCLLSFSSNQLMLDPEDEAWGHWEVIPVKLRIVTKANHRILKFIVCTRMRKSCSAYSLCFFSDLAVISAAMPVNFAKCVWRTCVSRSMNSFGPRRSLLWPIVFSFVRRAAIKRLWSSYYQYCLSTVKFWGLCAKVLSVLFQCVFFLGKTTIEP